MNCVDEIVKRLSIYENFSENHIRIILNDYDISPKCTEIVLANDDKRQKAIQMFVVTKKVEGCTENIIHYYMGTLRRFFNEINQHSVIEWLENEIKRSGYCRLKPLLSLLKGFDFSEWTEEKMMIVHYGH